MRAAEVWDATLGELQLQMTRANYDTWLKETFLVSQEGGLFTIGVESPFAVETLEQRLSPLIRKVLSGIVGQEVDVRFVVKARKKTRSRRDQDHPQAGTGDDWDRPETVPARNGRNGDRDVELLSAGVLGSPLNPRYTFDTFVVGKGNQLAHAGCQAVADTPAHAYNPLFIYGGVGLGKTHLMHAIGHETLRKGMRVLYVSSETFTNELIDSIREHRTEEFRNKYRRPQLLLIDDIQFLAGKERTQEEFFHTFNAIHEAGGQLVISSDRPPKAISTLEDRLRSRFEWGLIADIQPPDLETRIAILRFKCRGQGLAIPDDVLEGIARKVQSNIRELEGSLTRVVAMSAVTGKPITMESASEALSEVIFNVSRKQVKPAAIVDAVASYYGVTPDELRSKARDKRVIGPRQMTMYLLREETQLPLVEIGGLLGGRDHSTVLHSLEKVAVEVGDGGSLAEDLAALRQAIYAASAS